MKIAFVSYPVTDLNRAVRFYQKVLEIEPLFHREDWAEFKLDGQRLALQKVESCPSETTGATLFFIANPLEDGVERLQKLGATIFGPPEVHSYGKLARFKDPDGNIFGLYEPPIK